MDELVEFGVSPASLATQNGVPANRVGQIIFGKWSVTADTALRLCNWFGVEPKFWLNLQGKLYLAEAERRSGAEVRALPVASTEA